MDRRQWKEPCDERIVAEDVRVGRGRILRIKRGRQLLIYVQAGTVWLTQERDRRDIVAAAGSGFRIDSDGLVLVTALQAARVMLSAPLNAPDDWRIEGAARIDAGRHDHPRTRAWLARWHRLARLGKQFLRAHFGARSAAPHLDARTLKDIGLEGIRGGSFAERADHYRWRHDAHFGLRGDSFL